MPASKGKLNVARHHQGLSGLQGAKRTRARHLARKAAMGGVKQAPLIHYSQNAVKRWEWIREKCNPFRGQYPAYADCSSYTTGVFWSVLVHHFGYRQDLVNGTAWKSGYTGTQQNHGVRVKHKINWRTGDLVFYGDQGGGVAEHVAMYVGRGMVVSHGSEGAPYYCSVYYRNDINEVRRYI